MAGAVGFSDGDHTMTDDVTEIWWGITAPSPYPDDPPGTFCYVDGRRPATHRHLPDRRPLPPRPLRQRHQLSHPCRETPFQTRLDFPGRDAYHLTDARAPHRQRQPHTPPPRRAD